MWRKEGGKGRQELWQAEQQNRMMGLYQGKSLDCNDKYKSHDNSRISQSRGHYISSFLLLRIFSHRKHKHLLFISSRKKILNDMICKYLELMNFNTILKTKHKKQMYGDALIKLLKILSFFNMHLGHNFK